jgi:hypothetical protein
MQCCGACTVLSSFHRSQFFSASFPSCIAVYRLIFTSSTCPVLAPQFTSWFGLSPSCIVGILLSFVEMNTVTSRRRVAFCGEG